MKRFLSLLFLVSSASLLSANRLNDIFNWRPSNPISWLRKSAPVAGQVTTDTAKTSMMQRISQAPREACASVKKIAASHPNGTKVTLAAITLIAVDHVAKKTSTWYRENMALYIAFGEKGLHQTSQEVLSSHKPAVKPAQQPAQQAAKPVQSAAK